MWAQKVHPACTSDIAKRSDRMGDDFSALELDTDQDEEMLALFGRSPEPVTSSSQRNKFTSTHAKSKGPRNPGLNEPPLINQPFQIQKQSLSLLCITNKRPAAALNQSWPHKARQSIAHANITDANTSFDDLELDSCEPDLVEAHQTSSGTRRLNNASVSSAGATTISRQAHAAMTSSLQARSNTDSQATELWQSAYSRSLQASQASISVQRASTSQQNAQCYQSAAAHAAPRPLLTTSHAPDISTAMVCVFKPNVDMMLIQRRTCSRTRQPWHLK